MIVLRVETGEAETNGLHLDPADLQLDVRDGVVRVGDEGEGFTAEICWDVDQSPQTGTELCVERCGTKTLRCQTDISRDRWRGHNVNRQTVLSPVNGHNLRDGSCRGCRVDPEGDDHLDHGGAAVHVGDGPEVRVEAAAGGRSVAAGEAGTEPSLLYDNTHRSVAEGRKASKIQSVELRKTSS